MDQATATEVVARIVELRGPINGSIPDAQTPGAPPPIGGQNFGMPPSQGSAQAGGGNGPSANDAPRKRRGLQTVEDVGDIEGVRREDMRLLRKRLTIYNPDGRLDIMTAEPDLLRSIPGMTKLKLEQLLAARESGSDDAARDAPIRAGRRPRVVHEGVAWTGLYGADRRRREERPQKERRSGDRSLQKSEPALLYTGLARMSARLERPA